MPIHVSDQLIWHVILPRNPDNSRVKRNPDKCQHSYNLTKLSTCFYKKKKEKKRNNNKKKPQKVLNKRKCPSFNTGKIFQRCQSDFKASPHLPAPAKHCCLSSGLCDVPFSDQEVIDFPGFVHINLDEGSSLRQSQASLFVALIH